MKKKILVVDDDKEILMLVSARFSALGFQVLLAHNGKEGLKIAETEKPDLILLDVMLPEMDGFEVCSTLKSNPKFKNIPIVMLTGLNQVNDVKIAIEKGANSYISKPFDSQQLVDVVERLIKE